jgi:hypothetical protein
LLEVRTAVDENGKVVVENGTDLTAFLQFADRLVVWGNHNLDGQPLQSIRTVANYLSQFGKGQVILMLGLWDKLYSPDMPKAQMAGIPPGDLLIMLQSADQADMHDYWITPSFLMTAQDWSVFDNLWGNSQKLP